MLSAPMSIALSVALVFAGGVRTSAQASLAGSPSVTIYVDAGTGSDSNNGTQGSPFTTIQAAVQQANLYNKENIGAAVVVNPGIYREAVVVGGSQATSAPLVIEAAVPGTAIIAASDVLTGWMSSPSPAYMHPWTYNFGYCPIPSGWPTNFSPIATRSEMVFVNGVPLTQVTAASEVIPGTFFIDDVNGWMYLNPPPGTNMNTAMVEAATRPRTLTVEGRTNVTLSGLVLRHAANCINTSGAVISSSSNVLVDSVQAVWNNWGGLGVFASNNVSVENSIASYNGGLGFQGNQDQNLAYTGDESDYNNWRGAEAAVYDWGMGGLKLMYTDNVTIQNHLSYRNQAQGVWFDTDNENITIKNATISGNVMAGFQIERNPGPITIAGSTSCSNSAGLNTLFTENLTVTGNTFYNNGGTGGFDQAQLFVAGSPTGEAIVDWITGQTLVLNPRNVTVNDNVFQDGGAAQDVFGTYLAGAVWKDYINTLISEDNLWYDPATKTAFKVPDSKPVTLASWQKATHADATSKWAAGSKGQLAPCNAPAPAYADFSLNLNQRQLVTASGRALLNAWVNSFDYPNPVQLSITGLPAGVTASFSQVNLQSGMATITLTTSGKAVAGLVPLTLWATSGSRVHYANFYLTVVPTTTTTTVAKGSQY